MDPKLLEILLCPASRQGLRLADRSELQRLNRLIEEGRARTAEGKPPAPLAAALITLDGQRVYRIEEGIPVLLAEEAILLDQASPP
jgi:uncharacterized protein YbaR (Trm112 family)